jgi:beta-glucosidase
LPDWLVEGSQSILLAMFGGTEAGRATADIIAGDYNPSARLSVSWPVNAGQIPTYYNMRSTGRPHDPNNGFSTNFLDAPIEPRFMLGDGLSYTRFELGALQVDQTTIDAKGLINLAIDVQNVGGRAGEATLFLFIHDPVAQVTRPSLELKDFAKAELNPGQSKTVRFTLSADQLRYPGLDLEPRLDSGRIDIMVGTSARAAHQKRITVEVKLEA